MYEYYAVTLGESFRKSLEDFRDHQDVLTGGDESFRQGYLMGLHRVFTLMEQAADASDIPLESISLSGLSENDFMK